jgi:outer membrane receptor protein involved in Fe transport
MIVDNDLAQSGSSSRVCLGPWRRRLLTWTGGLFALTAVSNVALAAQDPPEPPPAEEPAAPTEPATDPNAPADPAAPEGEAPYPRIDPASTKEPLLQGEVPAAGKEWDITALSLEQLLNPQITTASRAAEKATEAPATVYVVSKNDIRAYGYSTLEEVLKDVPGMETVERYYSEQGTLVPVRGVIGNNKIILLVNGMRVNPPGGEDLMIRNDISVRAAEQIEIMYGPGSTLYGQDAISAVINIKTKKPGDVLAEAVGGYGSTNSHEGYASFATTMREKSDSPLSFSGFAQYRGSELSNFSEVYPDWWAKYNTFLSGVGDRGTDAAAPSRDERGLNVFARVEGKSASLQAWFRDSERSSAEGSGEGLKSPVLFFIPEARWRDRSIVVEGQHVLSLAESVSLTSTLVFNRYEVQPESRYVFPGGPTSLFLQDYKYGVGTGQTVEEKLDWAVSDSTRLTFGLAASNFDIIPKSTVLGGADRDGSIVDQAGALTYYKERDPATGLVVPGSSEVVNRAIDLHYQQYGAYAEGSHRFLDNLRLIAGVRVDVNTRFDATPVSPRAALVYSPISELTLKYIFTQAYVAPAPYFFHNVFDNGVQISAGNADLKPETAMSNEVNATWQTENLLVSGSGYYNQQNDLLLTAQTELPETVLHQEVYVLNPDGTTGMRKVARAINLGSSRAYGSDLSARLNLGPLALRGSYSFVSFKRTTGGTTSNLDKISAHNVRAGVTWTIIQGLSITPSLVLRSTPADLPDAWKDLGVSLKTPYEVNLHALYTPVKNVDAYVLARNLTNHKYALRGVSGPALQEPLSAMFGLRARY